MNKKEIINYLEEMLLDYNGSYDSYFNDYLGLKSKKDKRQWFKENFNCHGNTINAVLKELNVRY